MDQKLSISDIKFIYKLAAHKTDEELAILIKKPVSLVQMQFALMTGLPKRPWERGMVVVPASATVFELAPSVRPSMKEKKPGKKKQVKPSKKKIKAASTSNKKPKENKLHSAHAQALERTKLRKDRNNKQVYKTKPLDLTDKIAIKLNAKTTIWAKPGTSVEQLKKKYNIS